MLRSLVLAAAALLTLGGAVSMLTVGPGGIGMLIVGALVLVGCVFERVRYKRLATAPPDPRFQRTRERFRDDASGAVVTVWIDPATGERSYVRDQIRAALTPRGR